jgi:moderate conductance mechanosensitive channel
MTGNEFLDKLLSGTTGWFYTELPSLVLYAAVFAAVLVTVKKATIKMGQVLSDRAIASSGDDESAKRVRTLTGIIRGVAHITLWAVFIMVILRKINVDIAPILASAGIVGLAVGFGAQELVRDFISGFFILMEDQVRTGDVAIINGTGGLVEKIELRTITLRDQSGSVHVFQNGKINTLTNMTKEWSAIVLNVGVAYKENIAQVMNVMKSVADSMQEDEEFKDLIIEPIEIMGLEEFTDSAIVIRARIKTKPIKQWFVGRAYRLRLKEKFDDLGIEIPFPQTVVHWGDKAHKLNPEIKALT